MDPFEVKNALDTIKIIVDTREQNTESFRRRLELIGLPHKRQKLNFGDYSASVTLNDSEFSFEEVFSIERKMSLDELCACYGRERKRFSREFERAREVGAKVYLLVENMTMENALNGDYRSKLNSKALIASIFAWLARYDCQIIYCKAESAPLVIREIIYREIKERLELYERDQLRNTLKEI